MKETEAEKARLYYRKVNGDNSLIPNRINEDVPNFCFTPDDMIHFATDFSNQENKELKELLRRLYKNRAYNFSLEDIEEINKHLNNKP